MSFKLFLKIVKPINEFNILSFTWFEVYLISEIFLQEHDHICKGEIRHDIQIEFWSTTL